MITSKANSVELFLQRNVSSCTEMVKMAYYKSMIRPFRICKHSVVPIYEEKYSYD